MKKKITLSIICFIMLSICLSSATGAEQLYDLNEDGVADVLDCFIAEREIMFGNSPEFELDFIDINRDGSLSALDFKLFVRGVLGEEPELKISDDNSLVLTNFPCDNYVLKYENDNVVSVYDIEPNRYGVDALPKRSRFSQALTDAKLLKTGEDYDKMPEYLSIWILTEDPFGKNQMLYSVKNHVEGFPEIVYNDGVKKLFLYVGGELGGEKSLKDLLQYFLKSDKEHALDEGIEQLHAIVENVKGNRKVGEQYMTLQDMINYEKAEARQEARAEGLAEGLAEGILKNIAATIKVCKNLGASDEQIIQNLVKEFKMTDEEAKAHLEKVTIN